MKLLLTGGHFITGILDLNIMLLGATGYLGSNIAYELSNAGNDITCVVLDRNDIGNLKDMKVTIVESNIIEVEQAFLDNSIDWVINTVCLYSQNDSLYADMINANIYFPLMVLNLAAKYKVENYITIGTSLPRDFNMYSFSKHMFSDFGKFYTTIAPLNFIDLELEMFYGGRFEPQNRFFSGNIKKLKNNEDLLLTEGYQKRDIVRIEDVIAIIIRIINSGRFKGYRILPIGSGENHSIREMIEYMKTHMRSLSELRFGAIESRVNEPDTLANIGWYHEIEYELKYSFFEGLKDECLRYLENK